MKTDGHCTKVRRNIAKNFNRLSRVHERYRQTDARQTDRQTDGRATAYSEHEREFTFAKNWRLPTISTAFPRVLLANLIVDIRLKYCRSVLLQGRLSW